jgi:xanthine/CO dehydrogenase XdhC/CoxF family maturation factor
MKEIREIVQAWEKCRDANKKAALVTVVHLEGSSYRRPGARMLVDEEGSITGSISGGCLEGDALRKALHVMQQGKSRLVTYDTADEEDISFGVQLGCEGVIQVLFEPIDSKNGEHTLELLRHTISDRKNKVLVTLFDLLNKNANQPGTCLLVESDASRGSISEPSALDERILQDAKIVLERKQSVFKEYLLEGNSITAFIEWVEPPVSVVVVGAGNDAIPLVRMADLLGWETRVVDGRSTHAKADRFASACQILVSKPEKVLEQIPVDEKTVFVLMTHNYNYDLSVLHALLKRNATYIGVLGPRKKMDRMLSDLKQKGFVPGENELKSVFGPVGFEIGAETAEEIGLSILAEIKAYLSHKPGGSLKFKSDFIHDRADTLIEKESL